MPLGGLLFFVKLVSFIALCTLLVSSPAPAQEFSYSGYASVDSRFFTQTPRWPGQENGPEISAVTNPELVYKKEQSQYVLAPFYRQDSRDDKRTHFDLRKAYWQYTDDDWSVLAGIGQVSWDVAASHHLINIINQVDTVEDIVTEDYRLGQPMLNLTKYNSWGQLEFYVLPGFRGRTFSGPHGRIRAPLPVDADHPVFRGSASEKRVDFAGRYSHTFDNNLDFGIYYFHGVGREAASALNSAVTRILPVYSVINQVGTGIKYTHGQWTWKFEGLAREGQGKNFTAFVGGPNYTIPNVFNSGIDLGLMAEYSHDNRDAQGGFTAFDDDIFSGFWLNFNDKHKSFLCATSTIDKDSGETFLNLKFNSYLTETVETEFLGRIFSNAKPSGEIYPAEQDDYVQIRLIKHF